MRLIEDFEEKTYPIDEAPPSDVLKTLMEDRGLKQVDLAPLFGGRSRVSDALAGSARRRRRRSPHSLKRRRIYN